MNTLKIIDKNIGFEETCIGFNSLVYRTHLSGNHVLHRKCVFKRIEIDGVELEFVFINGGLHPGDSSYQSNELEYDFDNDTYMGIEPKIMDFILCDDYYDDEDAVELFEKVKKVVPAVDTFEKFEELCEFCRNLNPRIEDFLRDGHTLDTDDYITVDEDDEIWAELYDEDIDAQLKSDYQEEYEELKKEKEGEE
jgi:hypothetical protein